MASWLGLAGLAIAPVAGIDRLFATLHVGAHPAFAERAPAQSEMACYGWASTSSVEEVSQSDDSFLEVNHDQGTSVPCFIEAVS
jgi:hypothetical protein